MLTDLPLEQLQTRTPDHRDPEGLHEFWDSTLAQARDAGGDVVVEPVATPLRTVDVYDVTFPGFAGQPVKAWLRVPAGALERAERGERLLRWSNAGHPPPLLLHADGTAEFLETEPDLLIGFAPGIPRHDHSVVLEAGATLLVFTDGLVERRDSSLTDGLAWLAATAALFAPTITVSFDTAFGASAEMIFWIPRIRSCIKPSLDISCACKCENSSGRS